jgi:hypothetical protein
MISTNTIVGIDPKVCKSDVSKCEACIYGESHRVPFEESKENRANGILAVVHSDVCGPMQVASLGGSRYFVIFTDDYSKWSEIFCMKMKSEFLDHFKIWQKRAEVTPVAKFVPSDPIMVANACRARSKIIWRNMEFLIN